MAETSHRQMDCKWHMLQFRWVPVFAYFTELSHTNIHSCASIKHILECVPVTDNSTNADKAVSKVQHSSQQL